MLQYFLLAFQLIPILIEIVRAIATGSKYIVNEANLTSFLVKLGQVAKVKELTPEFVATIVSGLKEVLDQLSIGELIAEFRTLFSRV